LERCKSLLLPQEKHLAVCVLASGSRGNAVFISGPDTAILVDAGLSGIEIERRLATIGVSPRSLDAIVISHEHTDHVRGAGILCRRHKLPLYITARTHRAALSQLGGINECRYFACGQSFSINTLTIHPFSLSHDAQDPSGFTFQSGGVKAGLATDLGVATAMVKEHLKGCGALILEANHDAEMLLNGSYPWPVKQRIKSRNGHLSNDDSMRLLAELDHKELSHVVLAHLSHENNTPERALATVGAALRDSRVSLSVALQDQCGKMFHL